ncbi:MAG: hypothetical protein E6J77_04095, partial [Deltaproteobacteria bacterium]
MSATRILGLASASSPKAGARCGNAARRDLCRGLWVTMIPTATVIHDGLQATPVVTRRLPPPVESRAARDYDLRCNVD